MDIDLIRSAEQFHNRYRRNRIVRKLVSILACVVVFSTTYALILPAITMERETLCGLAEHQHTESCYTRKDVRHLACGSQSLGIHTHTAQCADGSCGYADFVIHEHNSSCYEDGKLVCSLPEVKAHTHTDDCYRIPTWEESGHTHTDECYTMTKGLSCGKTETEGHTHTDACRSQKQVLSCDTPESDGHHHGEGCYDENDSLTCTTPESSGHHHDASCYRTEETMTCDKEESEPHTHTDACYAEEKTLICTEKEGPIVMQGDSELVCTEPVIEAHEHTAACFDADSNWICGKIQVMSHVHADACFETYAEDVLTCTLAEHTHTEECYPTGEEATEEVPVMMLFGAVRSTGGLPVTGLSGNGTVYDPNNDQFTTQVTIQFEFGEDTGKPRAGVPYIYTYPAGIVVPDATMSQGAKRLYDGDKYAGTYQFIKNSDGTYSVQIIFDDEYIGASGDTVGGFAIFEGSFNKKDMNEAGDIVVGADDSTVLVPSKDIEYPGDETESYNIDVSKSGSWVQDGDKLVYTVYVRTTKGTPDPISFMDKITIPEGLTLGNPQVAVVKGTAQYYYQSWDNTWVYTDKNDWVEIESHFSYDTGGKLSGSLPGLSATQADNANGTSDVYKITYSYPITDQTVEKVEPHNSVTVSAEDTTKGQTVTDTDESTVTVNKDFSYTIDKTGAVASDKPGYIKWTVTVNNNKQNLAGAKLTDQMLGLVQNASGISVDPSVGMNINRDTNDDKIIDISFTAVENSVNKNTYTITYYTPVEESWNDTTVTNMATLDPDPDTSGDEKEATADVTVSGVQLNKSGSHNAVTNKLDWVITVNSGNLDIAGATLTDDMFVALSDSDFTIQPASGYQFTKDAGGKITGITFTAVDGEKNTQSYTIKYSTEIPQDESGNSVTSVTNTATLSPGEGKTGTPIVKNPTVTLEKPSLSKGGNYDSYNGVINWTVTVNEGGRNIAGAVLTDGMFAQLTGSIQIRMNNQTVTADSGYYTINTDESGKITSIAFDDIGETGVNTNTYVITYSTQALPEWKEHVVHNEAKLTLDGKEINTTADVTVSADGSIAKRAELGTVSEDGKTLTIPWTVTLTIPEGGFAAGTTLEDDVTKNQWGNTNTNQWMTSGQIRAWAVNMTWTDTNDTPVGNTYTPLPENVTFLASDGNTYTCKQIQEYTPSTEEGQPDLDALTYTKFTISYPDGLVPPEDATKLTFTYSTTADLTKASMGQNKFYNYVNAGGKETGAEYIYYKAGVIKTDGNWSTNKTYVSNEGALTWKVKAVVGEGNKKLTLSDTLPEGVTLESLQLTGWGNLNMELTTSEDGTISGTDSTKQYNVSGDYKNGVITLEIAPQTEGNTIQTGAEFTLTVGCQVVDAANQTASKELTNTVKMELDDVEIGTSSQTQEWTYQETTETANVVSKTTGWDNSNRLLNYSIVLNPEGKVLLDGSSTLTLVDTLSYTNKVYLQWPFSGTYDIDASLIQSSVKLYEAVWDDEQDKWTAGEVVTGWSWTCETSTGEYDWNRTSASSIINATGIPDGRPLMLQYSYRITSNVPDEQDGQKVTFDLKFANKAELAGTSYSSESSSSNMKWEHSEATAGVTTDKSYTFYKVETGNYNVSLEGAVFSVYPETSGLAETPVMTYTTDNKGVFRILRQEKDGDGNVTFTYDYNTLYKVVETAPPTGYKLPDKVTEYYFYFSSTEDTEHSLPESLPTDAINLTNEAKTVYVENVKNTTEITVDKVWKNHDGTPANTSGKPAVTINLYQTTTQGSSSGGGSTGGTGVSYTATCNNSTMGGTFEGVSVGDKVKISVAYTWRASLYDVAPSEWSGVKDGSGGYSSNGYIYDYTCSITADPITFITGDAEGSIQSITCTQVESSSSGATNNGNTPTTGTLCRTVTLNTGEIGWSYTFEDLPLTGTDEESGSTVTYYYYVKEISVPNYTTSYDNNGGIQSGTITVTNTATDTPEYTLPETGGGGTEGYTLGGFVLTAGAALWLLCRRKRRREAV